MSGKLNHSLKRNHRQITSSLSTSTSKEQSPAESPNHSEAEQEPSTSEDHSQPTKNQEQSLADANRNNAKRRKRNNCDTPDSSSSESEASGQNHVLLEALQKIIELESELEYLQNDDEHSYDDSDAEISQNSITNFEAEALGFAMCARETLLFLQKEGISENSLLYQALKDKLVGPGNEIPI